MGTRKNEAFGNMYEYNLSFGCRTPLSTSHGQRLPAGVVQPYLFY